MLLCLTLSVMYRQPSSITNYFFEQPITASHSVRNPLPESLQAFTGYFLLWAGIASPCLYLGYMSKMPFPRMLKCLSWITSLAEDGVSSGLCYCCSCLKLSSEGMLLSRIYVPITGILRSLSISISTGSFILQIGPRQIKLLLLREIFYSLKTQYFFRFSVLLQTNFMFLIILISFSHVFSILEKSTLECKLRLLKDYIQILTPNCPNLLPMSMRKLSMAVPVEPESPKQKPNQKAFQRWLHKNQFQHETPVLIENSFRNLEKPLEFIKDQKIRSLQAQSDFMIGTLHNQKESIAEMSKSTYKKVISRDRVDYQFGSSALQDKSWYRTHYQDSHKTQAKKKDDNTKILQKRNELTKQFIHNQHQYDIEQQKQKKELTLQVIKEIDSKDFQQKHKDVQFYEVFLRDDFQKHISNFSDISENYEMDELLNKIRFTLIDRDSYYSPKSSQYLFKAQEQLDFWRRYSNETQEINNADQIEIMKRCHNFNPKQPSFMQLLDFASGKLDSQILSSFFQLKSKQEAEIKINQNDENLEEQYNKKKEQYDFLRSMKMKDKTQKIAIKYNKNTTQTNDELEDQSFDSYFQESVKSLFIRLEELNKIRDSVMEKKQNQATKKTMLINIGHEIKNILFRLLAFTLQGETFVNYEEIVATTEESIAQKKILQIIYHEFHKVRHLQVDGIPKTKILDIYLEQREKNEKMFELLGRMYGQEKPTTQRKSKSPAPQKANPKKK